MLIKEISYHTQEKHLYNIPSNVQLQTKIQPQQNAQPANSKDHMVAGDLFLQCVSQQIFSSTTGPVCQFSTRMLLNLNFTRMKIPSMPEYARKFPETIFSSVFKKVRKYFPRLTKLCSHKLRNFQTSSSQSVVQRSLRVPKALLEDPRGQKYFHRITKSLFAFCTLILSHLYPGVFQRLRPVVSQQTEYRRRHGNFFFFF